VMGRPTFRREAARLQHEIAELGDPVATVTTLVSRLAEDRASERSREAVSVGHRQSREPTTAP
jgi:hypothetical protein